MTCERVRESIPECLGGRLDKATRETLVEHVETCAACRGQMAELGIVWRGLEAMPVPEPSRAMRTRFQDMLNAYRAGLEQARPAAAEKTVSRPARPKWLAWWPANPAWQMAIAAALLIAGVFGGHYAATPREMSPEMAQLKGQVEGLRQLVALSLLQEQSPSDRLRGVGFSAQINRPDAQVEQALLRAVNRDANVNVRLSAVDALQKYADDPEVRRALADSISSQDSALVQVAIIDMLVETANRGAAQGLRGILDKVAQDKEMDEVVRQRATLAVHKLEVTQ